MALNFDVAQSPPWWAAQLSQRLVERRLSRKWHRDRYNEDGVRPPIQLLWDYLRGDPPTARVNDNWSPVSRQFLRLSRMNYAELVVGAVADRVLPVGFRTSLDGDRNGDQIAQAVADENELALRFGDALSFMLTMGDGYMMVGPAGDGSEPTITAEDPRDVITAEDSATGATLAGIKLFRDEWDGADWCYVQVRGSKVDPGRQFVLVNKSRRPGVGVSGLLTGPSSSWEFSEQHGGEAGQQLPPLLSGLPMIRFQNRRGVGEFEPHLDVLDRINNTIFDRVTIQKQQAFIQRALKNMPQVYPEGHPQAGEKVEYDAGMFSADPGALWDIPQDAEIWESKQVDLTPLRMIVKDDVEALAAVTRTPLHMITPDAASGSAEGASTMREGHGFRVEDRIRRCDSRLARVMAAAFAWKGDAQRSKPSAIQPIWGPVERYSLEQKASASSQAKAGGLPQASIWTDIWGFRPADIPRLDRERGEDMLFDATVADKAPGASGGV